MQDYIKKPESQSRTLDRSPKASRQAPIDVILQQYGERYIQRYVEGEDLTQGKFDPAPIGEQDQMLPTMQLQVANINDNNVLEKEIDSKNLHLMKGKYISNNKTNDIVNKSHIQLFREDEVDNIKTIENYFYLRIREIGNPFTNNRQELLKMIIRESKTIDGAKRWINHVIIQWNNELKSQEEENPVKKIPLTKSYREYFSMLVESKDKTPEWVEQFLNDADATKISFLAYSIEEWKEKIPKLKSFNFDEKTVLDFFNYLFELRQMTQSCGITAGFIHQIISPSTEENSPKKVNLANIGDEINEANRKSKISYKHQCLRVEGGGHAFVIEIFDDKCSIMQSFFGEYSFADDFKKNKTFDINDFVLKITNAYSSEIEKYEQSRIDLFDSKDISAAEILNVKAFSQEEGIFDRLSSKFDQESKQWEDFLKIKAKDIWKT